MRPETVSTPEIRRQAILSVVTTKEEPDPDEPKPGANDVDPVIPKDQDKYLGAVAPLAPRVPASQAAAP